MKWGITFAVKDSRHEDFVLQEGIYIMEQGWRTSVLRTALFVVTWRLFADKEFKFAVARAAAGWDTFKSSNRAGTM